MSKKNSLIHWAVVLVIAGLLLSSCSLLKRTASIGEPRTETQTVELGSASEVNVQIKMGAGKLSVAGGSTSLLDGVFRYNVADWQPRISYAVNGSQGELVIDHGGDGVIIGPTIINDWNLQLSGAVPIGLEIETGAGEGELDMRGLDLTGLRIDVGAGNTTVDLSGDLDHNLNVIISGGVGEISVKLPGETGVRVSADAGIGGLTSSGLVKDGNVYVNDLFGNSAHTLFLDIQAGVGNINLLAP